ncbi:MAG: ice-binding family protein, partial [Acidobacteriota bacterium]|nr:ice-binding family protein [Acidobacteriota bacterium]
MTLFTLAALAGVGFFVVPGTSTNGVVSAQESRETAPADVATAEMLRIALDFRGATGYTVFADKGISDDGKSQIKGSKGVASRDGAEGSRVRQDLSGAFNAINQLPSTKLNTLSNGSYRAGSYSAPSAKLSGELVLDGGGDQNAIFIFRMAGALRAESDFSITFVNGAEPQNVFFVTNDTAKVAEGVNFRASILAMNTIEVGAGAKVEGRTLSLNGEVKLTEAAVGGGTGILEICKAAGSEGLTGRVFAFRIGSIVREAPVGGCTGPIDLPAGPVTIEELLDGRTLPSGTFSGRFRLIRVESTVPGSLGTVNLPLRTAVVNIREGSISNQTVVTFTNVFAVNAVVEICKRASLAMGSTTADSLDVTGFFNFTIDALPNMVFAVPVGACSGPIQVNVPTTPGPFPAPADVLVTEIGRDGFTLESASTFPADRFNGLTLGVGIRNTEACSNTPANGTPLPPASTTGCVFTNPGGGVADIDVLEGGTASQTTVNFFNRANPAILKVCKIAGPGIPEGTPFTFEVRGTAPTSSTVIAPGTQITRFITVPAGPAAQGGFCDFVRETDGTFSRFVVGTPIAVVETDFLTPIPGVGPGQVRTANIRSSTGFTTTTATVTAPPATDCVPGGTVTLASGTGGNPDLEFVVPGQTAACNDASFIASAAIVPSRASTVEVEFTNFVFNPTLLKICKIAGNGVAQGTPFTFNVAVTNPTTGGLNGPIFDPRLTTVAPVTVQAGPASSGGFCNFAQGPFTPTNTTPPVGTFQVGSTVTITENANPGTVVVLPVTSPTGTVTPVGTNGGSL